MMATIQYYDGKTYFVTIEGVSRDVITADCGGAKKNFTRSLINKIEKGFVTE